MSKYEQKKHKDFESNIRSILEDDEDSVGNRGSVSNDGGEARLDGMLTNCMLVQYFISYFTVLNIEK